MHSTGCNGPVPALGPRRMTPRGPLLCEETLDKPGLHPVDQRGDARGAKSVINIHHAHIG